MLSRDEIKSYAIKIYNNVPGYTLEKAFSLFPKYALLIADELKTIRLKNASDTFDNMIVLATVDTIKKLRFASKKRAEFFAKKEEQIRFFLDTVPSDEDYKLAKNSKLAARHLKERIFENVEIINDKLDELNNELVDSLRDSIKVLNSAVVNSPDIVAAKNSMVNEIKGFIIIDKQITSLLANEVSNINKIYE